MILTFFRFIDRVFKIEVAWFYEKLLFFIEYHLGHLLDLEPPVASS